MTKPPAPQKPRRKLKSLPLPTPIGVNHHVCKLLRNLLAEAEAGKIQAIAGSFVAVDGNTSTFWSRINHRPTALLGSLHLVMYRMMKLWEGP